MIDDRELVKQILEGNESVLRFFYRHFYPRLLTFIKTKVANEHDAEEILQDSLLATIDGMRDFSFKCALFTFICSIAYHKIIDYYRRKKIKSIVFSRLTDVEPLISSLVGPEKALDSVLLREKIKQTFKKLAPRYGLILKLKYIYGYSVSEIAGKLSITFKSAESQLFRARKSFVTAYSL